jgi:hypothetical protein
MYISLRQLRALAVGIVPVRFNFLRDRFGLSKFLFYVFHQLNGRDMREE